MIIPKEKRIIVYSIYDNQIINDKQKQVYIDDFKADIIKLTNVRNDCIEKMNNENNLSSFVYVHENGRIEKEINVTKSKYSFHSDYYKK